jgi:2-dehydropantoate 2-reductase
MRIIILGTGAMSCLFGARLCSIANVTLLGTWIEAFRAIRERGIVLDDGGEKVYADVEAFPLAAKIEPADLVLVLVKAWQTERVAPHLETLLRPEGVAITLQNGLGNLEKLGPRASLGVTGLGANLLGPGRVRAAGGSSTHVVAPDWVVALLNRAGFQTYRSGRNEMQGLLWGKLMVNCGINALSALLGIQNGELLNRPGACKLMERAALECFEVARAKGIDLPYRDPASRVREVAHETGANWSSMHQDLARGAPTECDVINGAVVREGSRTGVATPVNEVLLHLVAAASSDGWNSKEAPL